MKNDYLGYSLFNDVFNPTLQAFNRAVAVKNIKEQVGKGAAEDYANMISVKDRMKMAVILAKVADTSWEEVGKTIRMETA